MNIIKVIVILLSIVISTINCQQLIFLDLYSSINHIGNQGVCDVNIGGNIVKESQCVFLSKIYTNPTIFNVVGNGSIEVVQFEKEDTLCQGDIIQKNSYQIDDCTLVCPPDFFCVTYRLSLIDDVSSTIQNDSLVTIHYNDCLGGWESSFNRIEYYTLNTCDETEIVSVDIQCTQLTSTANYYVGSHCGGILKHSSTSPLSNDCSGSSINNGTNILQICNTYNYFGNSSSSSSNSY